MSFKKLSPISVIIPARPGGQVSRAIEALKKTDYPSELVEVFVSRGTAPARQRNRAAEKAEGEILYFLDNDSEIEPTTFKKAAAAFSGEFPPNEDYRSRGFSLIPGWLSRLIINRFFSGRLYKGGIGVVGGPNIWRREEPFWAALSGAVLESFFAHSLMAARYRPIGGVHRAGEKELILCNLAVRRDVFQRVGGFNEQLFPNEENELLNRIEKQGYQLIYHPGVLVARPRRETLANLLGAFFNYGRGRMEQIRIEGVWESLPILVPLVLLFYLLGLVFYRPWFAFLPLIFYFGLAFGSALGFAARRKKYYLAFFLPMLFLAAHLSYALGLLYGITTDLERRRRSNRGNKIEVVLLKRFGEEWEKSK